MYLNREELESDIDILIDRLNKSIDINDYKYLKCNVLLLLEIYEIVFHEKYDVVVPNSTLLEIVLAREEKSANQIYREEYLKDRDFHDKVSTNLNKILSKYELPEHIEQETIRLDIFLDIINSFFLDYGGDLNQTYENLLKNNHLDYLSIKNMECSETSNIFMLNKSYILINSRTDVEGLLTFAHEVAHAHAYSKIRDNESSYNDILSFCEFYPSFMERMMLKYLKDNNIMMEDTYKSNQKFFKQFSEYVSDLNIFKRLKIDDIRKFDTLLYSSMIYMYGEYLALIKEHDYLEDSEGTIERIDDYLNNQVIVSKEKSLDILGIDYDEIVSGNKLKRILKKNNM